MLADQARYDDEDSTSRSKEIGEREIELTEDNVDEVIDLINSL